MNENISVQTVSECSVDKKGQSIGTPNRFANIDGIKTLATIAIILLHVRSNGGFIIANGLTDTVYGYTFNWIIASFAKFVELFMMISGFGMCCGYYEKMKSGNVSLDKYYSRRYAKTLPFFALLVLLAVAETVLSRNFSAGVLHEAFADLTLVFGLMPSAGGITVVGVGWTLGAIFGFYILFPFFVWLIWNKKRAWISLVLSIFVACLGSEYFVLPGGDSRCNVMRWLCYFIGGGIIFLYKDCISRFFEGRRRLAAFAIVVGLAVVFLVPIVEIYDPIDPLIGHVQDILGFSLVLCGALMPKTAVFSNPLTKLISNVGLEMYLSHMLILKVLEKTNVHRLLGNGLLSLAFTFVIVFSATLLFALTYKKAEKIIKCRFKRSN